jgi:hypothetical protein
MKDAWNTDRHLFSGRLYEKRQLNSNVLDLTLNLSMKLLFNLNSALYMVSRNADCGPREYLDVAPPQSSAGNLDGRDSLVTLVSGKHEFRVSQLTCQVRISHITNGRGHKGASLRLEKWWAS